MAFPCRGVGGIEHRTIVLEFLEDQTVPFGNAITLVIDIVHGRWVFEIPGQPPWQVIGLGTSRRGRIIHLHGLTTILHKFGHRHLALLRGVPSVGILHLVPFERGGGQGRHCLSQRRTIVFGNLSGFLYRKLMVVDYLGHSRGNASSGALGGSRHRTEQVIRPSLVPPRGEQWFHHIRRP